MRFPFATAISEWRNLNKFRSLSPESRSIVFYAEDGGAWVHFEPIIRELVNLGKTVCYLASSPEDSVLYNAHSGILPINIGKGTARTVLFRTLQADVVVMTMPDLGTYHIKRSPFPVHYVYIHHSMVSTHMIYRPKAFDQFDAIFCVGPHHEKEIIARESLLGLEPKTLIKHGYARLDTLIASAESSNLPQLDSTKPNIQVLIAPSWGRSALLEVCGPALVDILVESGFRVIVRPHPVTTNSSPRLINSIKRKHKGNPMVRFETDVSEQTSLYESDIMISDWSGAAFEYAFAHLRPVLFIDVPKKINDPEYQRIPHIPMEIQLRDKIGRVIAPEELQQAPRHIRELCSYDDIFKKEVENLRNQWVYNIGYSGAVGAAYIAKAVDAVQQLRTNEIPSKLTGK